MSVGRSYAGRLRIVPKRLRKFTTGAVTRPLYISSATLYSHRRNVEGAILDEMFDANREA
jgi:hypothetical protein